MNKRVGVLGCGWLGLPLAKSLIKNSYNINGSTTNKEKLTVLKDEGIEPFLISLSPNKIDGDIQGFLSDIDILIINIPPRLRGSIQESFVDKMKLLYKAIQTCEVSKVIFISSTAVYGAAEGTITEDTVPKPVTESGRQLLASERIFVEDASLNATIIRFGGLIGPKRHPVTLLSGRKNLTNGNDPINLIHLEDCTQMIQTIIQNDYWGQLFNGVYPHHPSKKVYYTSEATQRGFSAPHYSNDSNMQIGKIVSSKNFLDKGHEFHTAITS